MPQFKLGDTNPIARGAYYFCTAIERGSHQFPLNVFFGLQSLAVCQWVSDFVGGVVEYPLALVQIPIGVMFKYPLTWPNRRSDFQAAINLTRYRNIHTDIV